MAGSFTREQLSGSTDGKPILIAATATPGTLIHTAIASTTVWDHIYASANNLSAVDVAITIEFGGTTDPDHLLAKGLVIPANAHDFPLINGKPLKNSLVVRIFAGTANVLTVAGRVNRYTP
jgi:hypothetical protein